MGLEEDLDRFRDVGEQNREDLTEFISHGNIDAGDGIKIPIKIIELPEFEYDQYDAGGVGQGKGDIGKPVDMPDGQEGEPGEEGGEHGHYEMDPEEFAEELDNELGLDLEPKGKTVKETTEGALVDLVRSGPDSTLDFETMYKKGLKRSLTMYFDEEYMREVLKVQGMNPETVFQWARDNNIPVSQGWIEREYEQISPCKLSAYDSLEDIDREYQHTPSAKDIDSVPLRNEDKRHKYPEITKEYEKNAVIFFIRDVSGSMGKHTRDLVERIFTPLDWYLTGKYDNAEFRYIAHDAEAWEVERQEFFGIKSGGGTRISSAYELAQERLKAEYPWEEWNRYVFAAGDGENWPDDTKIQVVPLMKEINANLHAYLQVNKSDSLLGKGEHGQIIDDELAGRENVAVAFAETEDDVMKCIYSILATEDSQ